MIIIEFPFILQMNKALLELLEEQPYVDIQLEVQVLTAAMEKLNNFVDSLGSKDDPPKSPLQTANQVSIALWVPTDTATYLTQDFIPHKGNSKLYQTLPNSTKPDQTQPNPTKLDQTRPNLTKPNQVWPVLINFEAN